MRTPRPDPFPWLPWAIVTLVTFAFAVPKLLAGLNIVTATYAMGSSRFWQGAAPYAPPAPGCDWFKYSPLFALLYWPFWQLPDRAHALLWGLLNAGVFWAGIFRWHRLERRMGALMTAAWIACSMELNGPLLYQQVNPLLIGLALLGLAEVAGGRDGRGGGLLALGANLKLLPGIFLLPLAPTRRRLVLGAGVAALAAFLVPALVVGPGRAVTLHRNWLELLGRDAAGQGLADLGSVAEAAGFPYPAALRGTVLAVSLVALAAGAWRRAPDWGAWISLGASAILLASPRTESPTFVLLAPAYLFLARHWLEERAPLLRLGGLAALAFGALLVTVTFNDIWPKSLWNPHATSYACKTWGTLILWALSLVALARPGKRERVELAAGLVVSA